MTRPGILSLRATAQYRRRDVLAYLGLRYYLACTAARSDRWAREVATGLVMRRTEPSYLSVQHFKDIDPYGGISHREMFIPGPNEALAEAALLGECASAAGAFVPSEYVYSYRLATGVDASGMFVHYVHGLRARHAAMARACRDAPDGTVAYLDIRRFYPSITIGLARKAWLQACKNSSLPRRSTELGLRILDDHARTRAGENCLLTGPMLSHVIGNLVLSGVDEQMGTCPARYFRYVDDIALVGSPREIEGTLSVLTSRVEELGLTLHARDSAKSLTVSARTWLQGEADYADVGGAISWMSLIGDLKRLLLLRPQLRLHLGSALRDIGVRIPIPDYSAAINERSYVERLRELAKLGWLQKSLGLPTIKGIVRQAMALRDRYEHEASELLRELLGADAFLCKRLLPKIRYRFGRLAYLGEPSQLVALAQSSEGVPALAFQRAVALAIATGDVSQVLEFGVNATQAAAQAMRGGTHRATLGNKSLGAVPPPVSCCSRTQWRPSRCTTNISG